MPSKDIDGNVLTVHNSTIKKNMKGFYVNFKFFYKLPIGFVINSVTSQVSLE